MTLFKQSLPVTIRYVTVMTYDLMTTGAESYSANTVSWTYWSQWRRFYNVL